MADALPKNAVDFKRECRKFFYYLAEVKNQMLDIKLLDQRMTGVHSIDFERVRTQRRESRDSQIVKYIELSTAMNKQLKEKQEKLLYVINTINRIEQPCYRSMIWMLYVQGMRVSEVAAIYDISKDYLSQLINDEIHKLFPKQPRKKSDSAV